MRRGHPEPILLKRSLFGVPLCFLPGLLLNTGTASSTDTIPYRIREHDTLSAILFREIQTLPEPRPSIYSPDGLLERTLKLNSHVKNSDLIFPGVEIQLPLTRPTPLPFSSESIAQPETPAESPAVPEPSSALLERTPVEYPGGNSSIPAAATAHVGLGYTQHSYQETGIQRFEQSALTLNANYQRPLKYGEEPSPWRIAGSGYFTLAPVTSNQPEVTARFLGINGRIGYQLPVSPSGWSASIWTGFYYTTMIVTSQDPDLLFGFTNQMGPQIQPTLTKFLLSGDSISTSLKFAPIGEGFRLKSPSQREIAWGLKYARNLGRNHATLSFDWADLDQKISNSTIQSQSWTLSFGWSW